MDPAVAAAVAQAGGEGLQIGIRPQSLTLGADGIDTEIVVVEELGSETFVFADIEHMGEKVRIRIRVDADYAVSRGDLTRVKVDGPVHVFGPDGNRIKTSEELGS